jgi:dipeptidyl aminopeptidase/acylaminoacyl peptidase
LRPSARSARREPQADDLLAWHTVGAVKPADLALVRIPGPPTLSPDGRLAVVAVTRLDLDADEYRSQLWLAPTDGSAPPRQITHVAGRDGAPSWSPDGRWLAFLRAESGGRPQLHVMPADIGEPRRITDEKQHPLGAGAPVWSPDSTRIAYAARVPEPGRYGTTEGVSPDKEPPRRITTLNFRADDIGFTLDRRPHVFVVEPSADQPQPVQLTDGDYDDEDVAWSPDGQRLAFRSARHEDRDTTLYVDVYTCAVTGGDLVRVTPTTLLAASRPTYTGDGCEILFLGHGDLGPNGRDFVARNQALWAVPADGSAPPRQLTDNARLDLTDCASGIRLDRDAALVGALWRGAVELLRVPLDARPDGPAPAPVLSGQRQVTGYAAAAGQVVASVANPSTLGELVAVRTDGAERTLSSFGAEMTERAGLRPMQEIAATAPDGYPVHGWILRPADPGPYPVLLMVHGGPYAMYGWTLFDEAQVYAGAGYAVVMGNPRGSTGYGEAHGRAIRQAMGTVDVDDLLALLDAALADPELDRDRVGLLGGSYGGFMTTWLAAHAGSRFRAAISERAVNVWDSFTGSSDIGHFFTEAYAGTDPQRLTAQSPLTHAARIDIPMLIIHSEQDWRAPVEQAQRLYVALKARGVPVELLLFPGEGHELSRSGLPSHRVARFEAILDWWARHLTSVEARAAAALPAAAPAS